MDEHESEPPSCAHRAMVTFKRLFKGGKSYKLDLMILLSERSTCPCLQWIAQ